MVDVEPFDSPAALALQRSVWRVQRLAWALMVLVVLAALLGLTGSGPLSRKSVTSADGTVRVEYERFLRRGATTTLRIHSGPNRRGAAGFSVWVARPYLEDVTIQGIQPPPEGVQAGYDRVTWRFEVSSQDPGAPMTVTIHLVPGAIGCLRAAVGLDARPGLGFSQWVYP
jgi:hypothetical protein